MNIDIQDQQDVAVTQVKTPLNVSEFRHQPFPAGAANIARPSRGHSFKVILLLLLMYGLAICIPDPGLMLLSLSSPESAGVFRVSLQHLLLGCLLLCAGLTVESTRIAPASLKMLPLSSIGTWLVPAVVIGLTAIIARWFGVPDGMIYGLVLATSMPIANSSVGWTHLASGNLPLSLGMLLIATIAAPLCAPIVFNLLEILSPTNNTSPTEIFPWTKLTSFLSIWVVCPALVGLTIGLWSRKKGIVWSKQWLSRVSLTCLLLLNYINASSVLLKIRSEDVFLIGLLFVFVSNAILVTAAWFLSRRLYAPKEDAIAFSLACGLRNTGAAVVLASTIFVHDPLIIMTILLQTLVQHLVAGGLVSMLTQRERSTAVTR
ncbi:bile acid:sodium symporter family protein [Planctomicrobium sp. SH527]|uniref:bile acid:sodium symporter family protein n=1 Tax=Planctomicrobium sp. SH527 TaxID=3448123 RepID=UPI003F5AF4EF